MEPRVTRGPSDARREGGLLRAATKGVRHTVIRPWKLCEAEKEIYTDIATRISFVLDSFIG
jgi:hypothetical protein